MANIYFFCIDDGKPAGGIRKIYRQVDVLNKHGFSAFVLHPKRGMRCDWFKNQTKIRYKSIRPSVKKMPGITYTCVLINFFISMIAPVYRLIKLVINSKYRSNEFHHFKKLISWWFSTSDDKKIIKFENGDILVIPEIYGHEISELGKEVKKIIFNQNVYYSFFDYPLNQKELNSPYLDPNVLATIVVSEHNKHYLQDIFPSHKVLRIRHGIDTSIFSCKPNKKRQIAFMSRPLSF